MNTLVRRTSHFTHPKTKPAAILTFSALLVYSLARAPNDSLLHSSCNFLVQPQRRFDDASDGFADDDR